MSTRRRILLADADLVSAVSLKTLLEATGKYNVTQVASSEECGRVLTASENGFDAVLLDISLPDEDGIAACARLRAVECVVPIILLSDLDDEMLLVRGLRAGADDFLHKPFRGTELLARLQARMRAFALRIDADIQVGDFTFHPARRTLSDAGRNTRAQLSEKEARLLRYLHDSNGEVVSRSSLLHAIWGYNCAATSHTVETHVYRLRQKLEYDPGQPMLIITERGGYRLANPLQEQQGSVSFPRRPRPDQPTHAST